ncbi:MAG: hypothetical protein ABFE08_10710 [Armatimonadia bacterium]
MQVRSRIELAAYLQDRMTGAYAQLHQNQSLSFDSYLVKTHMIEAHSGNRGGHDGVVKLLRSLLDDDVSPLPKGSNVAETQDESLFLLAVPRRSETVHLFVDAADPRFWLIHSMGSSNDVDWCIDRMTLGTPSLDTAWLPAGLLEWVTNRGSFRGLGLDFDKRKMSDDDPEVTGPVSFLKMQLWGNQAAHVLDVLRAQNAFPHATTLSKVKLKFAQEGKKDEFTLDDIKFNGKVTARGTSFRCHSVLLSTVYRRYKNAIEFIEANSRIGGHQDQRGWSVDGSPVVFQFDAEISDVGRFCERLFTCAPPFRLWGVPLRQGRDYYQVSAIDLHVGHPLDFEIGRDFMRVYLHDQSCGNTIVRLLTNLQHTVDAQVGMLINGNPVPELQS